MKHKVLYILLFAMGLNTVVNAQLNDYKYIIVPKKFDAFKSVNEYQTSTLVKYYFEENGFNALYDDALPVDLAGNRCLGLLANLEDGSNMFSTKITIVLKDCNNVEVYRSVEGVSKIKEYDKAYKDAIQKAFVSFAGMDYNYVSQEQEQKESATVTLNFKDDVKSVQENSKEHIIEQKATTEEQVYKAVEPKPSSIVRVVEKQSSELPNEVLYAQPTDFGYQLVDSTPKVVLKLQETSMNNVFMTDFNGNNAVVFQKDGKWLLEYSENGEKVQKELDIKF
ncbi:hypothetical protein J0656_14260 [Muricauda ruestringensis]|uniref:Secreted protein n=1 Tax=Flagellimonas aurea TaxID=2915619 RepID=A0ABS3G6Z0_9FLAO|nr:hypothetical protein [Allomuricauda aurea]MAO18206.1 hypothetical protein [Allomuricauda sp.]MBO0355184.1 hypothetical protein [Allomuricauda aurea]|tara:strand:+ start:340 stop:1179 length:840 start_codon:yes stop_codon:yes gene_type:complete